MRIRQFIALSAFVFCVGAACATSGERVDSTAERSLLLPETQVEAVKPVKGLKATSPLYEINRAIINKSGIVDLADALHRLPGVNLRDYGGAGGLKTVSVRGMGAPHTTVCYDGLPVSDAQNGAIDLSRFSLDNVNTLTLVVGDDDNIFLPAKVAAAPAMLQLTTPLPLPEQSTALTVRMKGGSFGLLNPYLNVSQRVGRRVVLNAMGEFTHALNNYPFKWQNGKVITTERRENNMMNSGHAELNLHWQASDGMELTAKGYYYDNRRQLPGPVLYYNVNSSKQNLTERNAFAQATWQTAPQKKWRFMAAAKFHRSATFYTPDEDTPVGRENYYQSEIYATGNVLFSPGRHWQFDYSADYIFSNLNSNLATDSRPYRHSILQSLTAKLSLPRITVTARAIGSVYLNGTANPTTYPGHNIARVSPSVALSARLLRTGLLFGRLGYKSIFRMPTFNEAFFNHFGSPNLQPETTEQINAGLTWQSPVWGPLKFVSLTADAYLNRVKDRIVAIPYNMFIWTVTNVAAVVNTGIDATMTAEIAFTGRQTINLACNYSYQRAKIDVDKNNIIYGKQVAYTPLHSGAFSVGWQNPWVNFTAHGQAMSNRWASNYNTPQSFVKGYVEVGATLWREIPLGHTALELRLDIINILNTQYYIVARYPMPGRAWQMSIKFTL